ESLDQPHDANSTGGSIYCDFRAISDVTSLLGTAGDAESLSFLSLLAWPPKRFRSSLEHVAEPGLTQILQTESNWIELRSLSERVHVDFAGKDIAGGRQATIRAAA